MVNVKKINVHVPGNSHAKAQTNKQKTVKRIFFFFSKLLFAKQCKIRSILFSFYLFVSILGGNICKTYLKTTRPNHTKIMSAEAPEKGGRFVTVFETGLHRKQSMQHQHQSKVTSMGLAGQLGAHSGQY
jgi:hypothetical protein